MNYDIPQIGDEEFMRLFDEFRDREISYKSKHGGMVVSHFGEAEEHAREYNILLFCQSWSTDRLEAQLEALSKENSIQKDITANEYFEMIRRAREDGQYEEFSAWNQWHRDMRSLHRVLAAVYAQRLGEKVAKYSPKEKQKRSFLGLFEY